MLFFICLFICLVAESIPYCTPVRTQTHTHIYPRSFWFEDGLVLPLPVSPSSCWRKHRPQNFILCAHRLVCYTLQFTRDPKGACLSAPTLSPSDKIPQTSGLSWLPIHFPQKPVFRYCGQYWKLLQERNLHVELQDRVNTHVSTWDISTNRIGSQGTLMSLAPSLVIHPPQGLSKCPKGCL